MDYKELDLGSYKLHLIKTSKFKTICFRIVFRDEIKKDEITIRNILIDNLVATSKKYPNKTDIAKKEQDLYGLELYANSKRFGNHIITEISMAILNPKYTEDNMLDLSLSFLHDIIFDPNVKDNKFDEKMFDVIKKGYETEILSLNENPKALATIKLKEAMGDYPFSYRMDGYLEDLASITPESLYDYYFKLLKTNLIDFYVIGNIDFYEIEKLIKKYFTFNTLKKEKCNIEICYKNPKKKIKEIIEESNFVQSNLAISCSIDDLTPIEREFVVILYNIILGNSSSSKLFLNVREKNSYAYSINSFFKRLDGILLIFAGIAYANYKGALKEIKKSLKEMVLGNITDEEIENAKELFISTLKDIYDYPSSILDYYFSLDYLKAIPQEDSIKKIKQITKEDIIAVAKKINIDTIYLIKEGKYEEN